MKSRLFLILGVVLILAVVSSCTNSLMPSRAENTSLMVSIGSSSDDRATYAPVFGDPPLSSFKRINLTVTKGETEFANINQNLSGQASVTISLPGVPYGNDYTITAKAYVNVEDPDANYGAFAATTFSFASTTAHVSLTLAPVISGTGYGTLTYTLSNPDPATTVTAGLYKFTETGVTGGSLDLQASLTVNGIQQSTSVPVGYYVLQFGDNVPSIVHIYKDLETVLAETNDLFNLSVSPSLDSSVSVTLSRSGIVRAGTTVTITMSDQYLPGSVSLNGGADNAYLTGVETDNGLGVYTRTFTMPNKSVVVSATKRTVPDSGLDFVDPNESDQLRFWSTGGSPAIINSANPGDTITILANSAPVTVMSWYLDGVYQPGSNTSTFTIPADCTDNYVGVLVYIDGLPYAVAIPINQP